MVFRTARPSLRRMVPCLVAGLLAAAMLAVGCGESSSPRMPRPTGQSALLPSGTPQVQRAPAPAGAGPLSDEGPLTVALSAGDFGFLPRTALQRPWQEALFDYIVGASPAGALDQSGLAISWQSSADMKTWTLRLRADALFQDGERATSEDVRGTLEFHARPGSLVLGALDLREGIADIRTPDPRTVVIRLKKPDFLFVYNRLSPRGHTVTGLLLPEAYLNEVGPTAFDEAPVGTGPYRLAARDAENRVALVATGEHWLRGGRAHGSLTFERAPEEAARIALLRSGQADIVEVSRAGADIPRRDGLAIFTKAGTGVAAIVMHEQYLRYSWPEGNPLSHVKVREALGIAIDRQALVDTFFHGLAIPTASYPVMSWDPAYQRLPPPAFDPTRARELLAEVGYPQGFTLDVAIVSFDGMPEGPAVMAAVADGWERIGLRINPRPMELAYYEKAWFAQAFGRPTVGGVIVFPNRFDAVSLIGFTLPESSSRLTEDRELLMLATRWRSAGGMEEYVSAGRALRQAVLSRQVYSTTLAEVGDVYAAGARVRRDWDLGKSPYGIAIQQVAAGIG